MIARGETGDRREETLAYFGPHPIYMVDRITKQGGLSPLPWRTVKVFGNREEFSREFLSRIQSAMEWLDGEKKIFENRPEDVVLLRPLSPLGYLRSMGKLKSRVPRSMGSPQARPWSPEFQAILRFSEKNIRIR